MRVMRKTAVCRDGSAPSGVPRCPRWTALMLACILIASTTACKPDVTAEPERAASQPSVSHFADYLEAAEVERSLATIQFRDPSEHRYLSAGWGPFSNRKTEEPNAWTSRGAAIVEVPRVQKEPLRVLIDLDTLSPSEIRGLPQQSVEILWNGHTLGLFNVNPERQTIRIEVPERVQRIGPNRLELVPAYWASPGTASFKDGFEDVGVRSFGIVFEPAASTPTEDAVARESTEALATRTGDSILQRPESVISFYFRIPEEAELRGKARLRWETGESPNEVIGTVALTLLDSRDEERIVFSKPVEEMSADQNVLIAEDLAEYAGQYLGVNLSFSLSAESLDTQFGDAEPILEWSGLRIEGSRPELDYEEPKQLRDKYNVMIILFDTLRADHTGPYGATSVRTPHMDALAERGTTFVNAFANSHWTRSSVASLFTATYPNTHGTRTKHDKLPSDMPTLAGELGKLGLRTGAFIRAPNAGASFGFDRDFDEFHRLSRNPDGTAISEYGKKRMEGPAALANFIWEQQLEPFVERAGDKPFFIYLHELDPHDPYAPPAPYDKMYDFGYGPKHVGGQVSEKGNRISGTVGRLIGGLVSGGNMHLRPDDVRYLNSLYRGEISYMDKFLGTLMNRLEGASLSDRTLVVLLSDHGEEFMEHGNLAHGASLYDELIRIPMILSLPEKLPSNHRVATPSQQVDIAPTILDLLGAPAAATMQGRSLLPYIFAPEPVDIDRATFSTRLNRHEKSTESVRQGNWKLLEWYYGSKNDRYEVQLFNVSEDPGELSDRWQSELVVGKGLQQKLREQALLNRELQAVDHEQVDLEKLSPEVIESLRALGYLQ